MCSLASCFYAFELYYYDVLDNYVGVVIADTLAFVEDRC